MRTILLASMLVGTVWTIEGRKQQARTHAHWVTETPPPRPQHERLRTELQGPCAPCYFQGASDVYNDFQAAKISWLWHQHHSVFRFRIKGYILSYCHKWKKHYLELGVVDGEILETHINPEFRVFTPDCVALCSFLGDSAPGLVLLWASREPGMEKP